jgi:hypothetical protein
MAREGKFMRSLFEVWGSLLDVFEGLKKFFGGFEENQRDLRTIEKFKECF